MSFSGATPAVEHRPLTYLLQVEYIKVYCSKPLEGRDNKPHDDIHDTSVTFQLTQKMDFLRARKFARNYL